jgi:small-conductance mechanosensitive channel
MDIVLFHLGNTPIRLSALLITLGAAFALILVSRLIERWLVLRLLARTRIDAGARQAIGTLTRYAVLVIGFAVLMQNIGISLGAVGVLAGALGVGIGFGLQNVFSNFISGLIVMIERPVKVGDRIDFLTVAGVEGDVVSIGLRTTTLRTARHTRVIVPNQKFVTEMVRNWGTDEQGSSVMIAIRIAAGQDRIEVQKLLVSAALNTRGVVDQPVPTTDLVAADAAGSTFQLQAWMSGDVESRTRLQSRLYLSVLESLDAAGIKLA